MGKTEGKMVFSLKPVFVGWMMLLAQLPLQIFLSVWAAGFFGLIAVVTPSLLTGFEEEPQFGFMPFLVCGAACFVVIPLIFYIGKKLNYARTEYRFFPDRLEFEEGFLTVNRKAIRYADVKEITLRKSVLQRMCGLGTIYLATQATGIAPQGNSTGALSFTNVTASGIAVRDIRDSDQNYEKIRVLAGR
jgi:membrane protein YdbS with pleckstrin-like domain